MCEVANQALIESSPACAVLVNGAGSESAQLLPNMVTYCITFSMKISSAKHTHIYRAPLNPSHHRSHHTFSVTAVPKFCTHTEVSSWLCTHSTVVLITKICP